MFSVESTPINKFIQTSLPGAHLSLIAMDWRDENSNVIRKVVTGLALIPSGLISLIDAVLSAVATVLTSPLLLVGSSIPKCLANRTILAGVFGGLSLTLAQYYNFTESNLHDTIVEIY